MKCRPVSAFVVIKNSPPSGDVRELFGPHEPGFQLTREPVGVPPDVDGDRVVEHPVDRAISH